MPGEKAQGESGGSVSTLFYQVDTKERTRCPRQRGHIKKAGVGPGIALGGHCPKPQVAIDLLVGEKKGGEPKQLSVFPGGRKEEGKGE